MTTGLEKNGNQKILIKLLINVYFVSLAWFESRHSFINSAVYWASTMFEEKKGWTPESSQCNGRQTQAQKNGNQG